jgi:WD40 repeat protein
MHVLRKWTPGWKSLVGVAILVGAALCAAWPFRFSLLPRTFGEPERIEGDWRVTTLGRLRFTQDFDKAHRLLVACEGRSPELWDTEHGRRVAVLNGDGDQLSTVEASADESRFVIAYASHPESFQEQWGIVPRLRIYATESGSLLKQIAVDLLDKRYRNATDWRVRWCGERQLLVQFNFRANPARASHRSVFGLIDVDTGNWSRVSEPLEISERLTISPNRSRALATSQYAIHRGEEGGVGSSGWGTTYKVSLVDMDSFKVMGVLDAADHVPGEEPRSIVNVIWSADGQRIATVGSDHTVRVWEGRSGNPVSMLTGHTDWVLSVCFSPDARRVLTASNDETARVWDAETGKALVTLTGHTLGLTAAVFDRNGERILTGAEDQTARLWDARTGKLLETWPDHESGVRAVAFAADGEHIRTETAKFAVRVWSVADGSLLSGEKPLANGTEYWSRRSGVCYFRQQNEVTEVWAGPPNALPPSDLTNPGVSTGLVPKPDVSDTRAAGGAEPRLTLHGLDVNALAFSPDGKTLVSATHRGAVVLWNLVEWDRVTGRGRQVLYRGPRTVALAFSPDSKVLATGRVDGLIRLWDVASGRLLNTRDLHGTRVRHLAYLPDGETLLLVCFDPQTNRFEARYWQPSGENERTVVIFERPSARRAKLSADCRTLALAFPIGKDGTRDLPDEVVLWDLASGQERCRLRGHKDGVLAMAFARGAKTLATAGGDKLIHVWDVENGAERATFSGASDCIASLVISPDGRQLAAGDEQGDVRLWDLATSKELAVLKAYPSRSVSVLVYSPDGKALVSGGGGTVKLWDVAELVGQGAKK